MIKVAKAKKEKKEKAPKKRKKGAQEAAAGGQTAVVQKAPKVGGGILIAILKLLIVLLSLLEIGLVLFIGFRYFQTNVLGEGVQVDPVINTPVQTQTEGRASYIGPGLYIKNGVVIYDYAGITGTAIPGGQQ